MRNIILGFTTLLALGGVASADRRVEHRDNRDHRAPQQQRVVERRGTTNYGGYRGAHYYDRVASARRPIYVQQPRIRERYYDVRVRPRLIAENYQAMDGYTWVAGAWQWSGAEWIWQPGHYEPIADYGYGYAPY